MCLVFCAFLTVDLFLFFLQPAGLLNYLDSTDQVPESALEAEQLNTRDNLKIAQDSASRNKRNPHLIAVERQFRQVEKHVEVIFFLLIGLF